MIVKDRLLVTGIHGFIGGNLVRALGERHQIYGLDIVNPPKKGVMRTFDWDAMDQLPAVNTIIHLAGKAHDTKNVEDAQSYYDVNLGLTRRIFEYFLRSQAEKFIFISSVKAVADTMPCGELTEEDLPDPQTPYGKSKLAAEEFIRKRKEEVFGETGSSKKIYILRPCMIHGPGNKGHINLLFNYVKKRIPWPLGAYENRRSYLSIDNLNFILNELIGKAILSGIYHIADDDPLSTNEIIRIMGKACGRDPVIWKIPKRYVQFLAKLGDSLHLPLNNERLKKLTESYCVSNKKIKSSLGIRRLPENARQGIKKSIEYMV